MPLNYSPSDRIVMIVIGSMLAVVLLLVALTAETDPGFGASPSSYENGSSGAKAAYLLLEATGYHPSRWTSTHKDLEKLKGNATLVMPEPALRDQGEIKALQAFLSSGGRIVTTGIGATILLPGHMSAPSIEVNQKSFTPAAITRETRGIREISLVPTIYFNTSNDALFKNGAQSAVIRIPYGKGTVIWWSSPEPLTNAGISDKDNAQLLLNSVGEPGSRPVFWDETSFQKQKTVLDSIWASPLKWTLLQLLVVASAFCFTWSRRFAPIRAAALPSRATAQEFVETLGNLFQRAKAGNVAVQIVYERFRRLLHSRCSVRKDVPVTSISPLLQSRVPPADADRIQHTLETAEDAVLDHHLSAARAREIVAELHSAARQLDLWH